MIEGIAAQTVTDLKLQNPLPQTVLPTPTKTDVTAFNTILQQAEVSKTSDLKLNAQVNHDVSNVLQKIGQTDAAYRQMLNQKQELNTTFSPQQDKGDQFKIRTVDDINVNPDKNMTDQVKERFNNHLEQMRFVNDKFANIMSWSTNMSVFSSSLRSASEGFKTLFRSSG